MLATLNSGFVVLAAVEGIPGSDWRAKAAVPIGLILFVGSVYLLIRSNLGTRRGYLVMATSLWGFMVIYGLFWTFGAPGTPPATGPQNLPGQQLDAYEDTWRPFAGDSLIADDATYAVAKTYPEGFTDDPSGAGETEAFVATADTGVSDTQDFFSAKSPNLAEPPVGPLWTEVDRKYAEALNGRPIIAVTYQETWQIAAVDPGQPPVEEPVLTPNGASVEEGNANVAPPGTEIGDPVEGGATYTAFAYFDAGSPAFPSLLLLAIMTFLFVLHAALLARDERRERLEREALRSSTDAAEERVPVASPSS